MVHHSRWRSSPLLTEPQRWKTKGIRDKSSSLSNFMFLFCVSQDIGSRTALEPNDLWSAPTSNHGNRPLAALFSPFNPNKLCGFLCYEAVKSVQLASKRRRSPSAIVLSRLHSSGVWKDVAVFHAEAARPRTDSRTVQDDTHLSSRHRFPPLHLRPSPTSPVTLQHDSIAELSALYGRVKERSAIVFHREPSASAAASVAEQSPSLSTK